MRTDYNIELKLTTNQFARGRVMDIPLNKKNLNAFLKSFCLH